MKTSFAKLIIRLFEGIVQSKINTFTFTPHQVVQSLYEFLLSVEILRKMFEAFFKISGFVFSRRKKPKQI